MANIIITVFSHSLEVTKQIEMSINDELLTGELSRLPDFVKNHVESLDSDFEVIKFSLFADKGISWQ